MAGTISIGASDAKTVVVSKSSARPWASFAIVSAVAGAITIKSALSAAARCETSAGFSQTVLKAGCPERASQVARPTKLRLDWVGMTRTRKPALAGGEADHKLYRQLFRQRRQEQFDDLWGRLSFRHSWLFLTLWF